MTLETYSNFIEIVECGGITAASEKLLIAQPALSTQLKNLEKTLGVQLIYRGSRKVKLTPAGEIFYKNAKVVCSVNNMMLNDIENYSKGTRGILKISMPPSNPVSLLMELFDDFVANHPDVDYQIYEVLSNQVAENVRNGISEIGMIRTRVRGMEDFDIYPYADEEMMVIVHEDHPLAKKDSVTLEEIKDIPIATVDVVAASIEQAFATIGYEPHFMIRASIRRTAMFWTSHYMNCITILPCNEEELVGGNKRKALHISDYDFSVKRSIIVAKDRELSPIAKDFLENYLKIKR